MNGDFLITRSDVQIVKGVGELQGGGNGTDVYCYIFLSVFGLAVMIYTRVREVKMCLYLRIDIHLELGSFSYVLPIKDHSQRYKECM